MALIPGFKGLVLPTSFTVPSTATVQIDYPQTISYTITPSNATNQKIKWSSSDTSVATVDSKGVVTAVSIGTCTITGVLSYDGTIRTVAITTIIVHPSGVELNESSYSLLPNETVQLVESIIPENANNKNVSWSSSNNNIATVSNTGLVTYISDGDCVITVTTEDGGLTDTCNISCIVPVEDITLSQSSGRINAGGTLQLVATITPSDASIKDVIWTSSDTDVAIVDSDGLVTYVADGDCIITATTVQGGFTASCNITCISAAFVRFLLIGGGGGGGAYGGGGGAGGYIECFDYELAPGTYPIVIGAGGLCGSCNYQGCNGGNSTFNGFTAYGGGGGGGYSGYCYGCNGGSGGGGGYQTAGTYNGKGTSGQGNNGGCNQHTYAGGGGGGAGAVGGNSRSQYYGGFGGCGKCSDISGTTMWYAGGGGGGNGYGCSDNNGGCGGGGHGGYQQNACNNATYYGGGGGGRVYGTPYGCGYQGIFILSYPSSSGYNITGGNCKYLCNGNCIHCFTGNGTLVVS